MLHQVICNRLINTLGRLNCSDSATVIYSWSETLLETVSSFLTRKNSLLVLLCKYTFLGNKGSYLTLG